MQKLHFPKLKWEIDPSPKCPCGSGLQFRKCCRGNESLAGKAQEFVKKKDYESAERALRAELTRYIGWVFRHTLILLKHPSGPPLELMTIDIGALEEYAERFAWVLEKQGKRESILHTFDHLATTIPLPGLKERMAFLKCTCLLYQFNDREQANRVLAEWPSHEKIQDYRLLQAWFDIRADSLSPIKRIEVVNKIIEQTNSPVEKLHYSIAKTMLTALIGETDEAKKIHTEALNAFLSDAADAAKDGDYYAASMCAGALELQGMLNNDLIAFERALSFLEKVPASKLNATGLGDFFYQKGRLNWLKGDSAQAIKDFSDSYKNKPAALPLIYRLDAYVRVDELAKAKGDLTILRGIDIPEESKLEFLRSAAALAVKACDVDAARNLVKELKALALEILNFSSQRDKLCVDLLEFIDEQLRKKPSAAKRLSILERIQKAADYFELKPNFCGLGLNLNKLFERKDKDVS
jgi:tetratricopeptide (TPR) repeat protein